MHTLLFFEVLEHLKLVLFVKHSIIYVSMFLFNQVKHESLSCFVSKTINAFRVRIDVPLASVKNYI